MGNPRWQSGHLSTGFIREEFPDGFRGVEPDAVLTETVAAVAVALDHTENRLKRRITPQANGRTVRFSPNRVVKLGSAWIEAAIVADDEGRVDVSLNGPDGPARRIESAWMPGQPVWHGIIDGTPVTVQVRRLLNGYRLTHRGVDLAAHVYTAREAELAMLMPEKAPPDTSKTLLCPMPGLVVSINVAVGQEVKAGETLAIVEAMKMENVLRAERDVVVKAVRAAKGDTLAVDAVIMDFE
jgi:propionyl-CoA carboxylase alpha chain